MTAPTSPASGALPADKIATARKILARLCDEGHVRMSVPARLDEDEDFILKAVIDLAALASREASPAPLTEEQLCEIEHAQEALRQIAGGVNVAGGTIERIGDIRRARAVAAIAHKRLSAVLDALASPQVAPALVPAAWINRKVIYDAGNDKITGYGETELSFKRLAYGYDYANAQPLYLAAPAPVAPTPSNDWNDAIEAAAKRIENGSFLHDQAPAKLFANEVAPVLRSMKRPGVEVAPTPAQPSDDARDAARWRKLRAQDNEDFLFAVVKNPHFDVFETPEELDAAVDALPSEQEGETP